MSINALIDGTTYEGINTVMVGGKTIALTEVSASEFAYPELSISRLGNTSITNGKMQLNSVDDRRAFIYRAVPFCGGVKYTKHSGLSTTELPEAYPLYIPYGATKITVLCTDLCCAINVHKDIDGTVTAVDNGTWSAVGGEVNYDLTTFIANGGTHISIGLKNEDNTSLESYTMDGTTIQVFFS